MANDLVRLGSLLGGTKNIVGNKYADLVLETLGKVYIKTGNSSRVLNDIFKLLDDFNKNEDTQSKVIIVESLEKMEFPGDGMLIFDTTKKALYIAYDQRYVLLIDSLDYVDDAKGYVKRSGDTMTGQLTIKTEGAPLIVASKELVKNLNAEYLGGHSASRFAVKILNEKIYGEWSFLRKTTFNGITQHNNKAIHYDNLVMDNADIVTTGSIGSPEFASGFLGYGWRFDAATQMLTVDYLVVRKAMQVFELIVNLVKATNGALWVTDSCEVEETFPVYYLDIYSDLDKITTNRWYIPYNGHISGAFISGGNVQSQLILGSNIAGPGLDDVGAAKTFYNFNYLIKFNAIPEELTSDTFLDLSNFEEDGDYEIVHLFEENNVSESTNCEQQLKDNTLYNLNTTPYYFSTNKKAEFNKSDIRQIYSYYKYFGIQSESEILSGEWMLSRKINVVKMKEDTYPTFREGDLIRCLKFLDNNIKYYDALVGTNFNTYYYVILVADSVFDKATTIKYSDTGELQELTETYNSSLYDKTSQRNPEELEDFTSASENFYLDFENQTKDNVSVKDDPSVALTTICAKDGLVRIGNLYKKDRQNSVFITSAEEYSPYVLTMNGVDRPDYSVVYTSPKFKTRRKVVDGKIEELYYETSDTEPSETALYEVEWVIDDKMENPKDENLYIQTEDGLLLYMQNSGFSDDVLDLIKLEHIYKKIYLKYYDKPNINCEIEQNEATGLYKSTYSNHVRARFGRLDGIYHEMFGDKLPYGYGLYGDNVFLTGEFFLSNGTAVADIGDNIKFEITNDFGKAGLYIQSDGGKPYIVLTADLIKILTGKNKKTALFVNGRIEASLIRVSDVEAALSYNYFVADENGEYLPFTFSFNEGLEQAMLNNGHKLDVDDIRLDEDGEVYTEIDKTQPFVQIISQEGKLIANEAELLGGRLDLYSLDKLTKVTVSADESNSYAGMVVYRRDYVQNEDEGFEAVAYYNGEIISNPYTALYDRKNTEVNFNNSGYESLAFGDRFEHEDPWKTGYEVKYNRDWGTSYIPDYKDDYGHEYGEYGAYEYYHSKQFDITTLNFVLELNSDVRIVGSCSINGWADSQIHDNVSMYFRIKYYKEGSTYPVEVVSKSIYGYYRINYDMIYFYGANTLVNFNQIIQLPPGSYKLVGEVTISFSLMNRWFLEHEQHFWGEDTPSYRNLDVGNSGVMQPECTVNYSIDSITILSNKFSTRYFGNGFSTGFNKQNYFSAYHDNNGSLVLDMQSNGAGMKFDDGEAYYYARIGGETSEIAMPIMIYSGFITPSGWNDTNKCMAYSGVLQCLKYKDTWGYYLPSVQAYKIWKENNFEFGAEKRSYDHGDFVIDFRRCDAYLNIDLSGSSVMIQVSARAYETADGSDNTSSVKPTIYGIRDNCIRILLSDDVSPNDGAAYVSIFYYPALNTSTASEE